ncbi:DUF1173 family protein [Burkholderia ubonensis]|uniref:DUF1173 family protein n=1 Tax=Burkholderia ubonensis TaxID=101571 RepID=UPI0009B45E18
MTCFEIAAKVYRVDDPHLSDALATLYGSPTRLRCRCREGGVKMDIAKRGSSYVIKQLSGNGAQHTFDCEFYPPWAPR